MKFEEPIAYSERAEGWACDYYNVDDVLISTGYAPVESMNTHCDYETVRKYDDQAREIACDYSLKWEEQQEKIRTLLAEFIKEVTA